MGDFQREFSLKLMKIMLSPLEGSGPSLLLVLFINALGYCPPGTPPPSFSILIGFVPLRALKK